jgi:hypothetical protein
MKTSKFICAALLLFGLVLIIFKTTNAKTTGKISANKKHHQSTITLSLSRPEKALTRQRGQVVLVQEPYRKLMKPVHLV